jgi:hypothetical protein
MTVSLPKPKGYLTILYITHMCTFFSMYICLTRTSRRDHSVVHMHIYMLQLALIENFICALCESVSSVCVSCT